jgi:hypothetical protein
MTRRQRINQVARQLRTIKRANVKQSFDELHEIGCKKAPDFSRAGLKMLDYHFLKHRLRAKTRRGISFYNALGNEEILDYLNEKIRKVREGINPAEHLQQRYSMFQLYYGSINQFRPTEALKVYCALKPRIGILDFSAGWGGRALAAMAAGIPYIGVDANKRMESAYKKLIEEVHAITGSKPQIKMIFKPSETVDFSKYKYDLIFTSPPYFMIEKYEGMPSYMGKEAFLVEFFRPVVAAAWDGLAAGGHMALNMPEEMYDAVKAMLPPLYKRMELPVSNRHPVNAARGRKIGQDTARHEYIYIWRKVAA